jgi:hypothetical protein
MATNRWKGRAMFQPEAKSRFVSRYCNPRSGWIVFVDIDASEEGRTGGDRKTDDARQRQREMQEQGQVARRAMESLGITVGGSRREWFCQVAKVCQTLPTVPGDRDVVAIHPARRKLIVAEVEGDSSGQPETKLYKAIGQTVVAVSNIEANSFEVAVVIVVYGTSIAQHLRTVGNLAQLGISGVSLGATSTEDEWCFTSESWRRIVGMSKNENV